MNSKVYVKILLSRSILLGPSITPSVSCTKLDLCSYQYAYFAGNASQEAQQMLLSQPQRS